MLWKKSRSLLPKIFFIHIPKTGGSYIIRKPAVIESIEFRGHCYAVHKDNIPNFLYYPHMEDWLFRTTVNLNYLKERFVFTTIRNPFSWLVSYYGHARGINPKYANPDHYDYENAKKGFNYLLKKISQRNQPWPCRKFIFFQAFASNGELVVDWFNRKETLDEDLMKLAKEKDLKYTRREKVRIGGLKDYRGYYNNELIDIVLQTWQKELNLFGYDFEGYNSKSAVISTFVEPRLKKLIRYDLKENILSLGDFNI
jgi:hypothetical protein